MFVAPAMLPSLIYLRTAATATLEAASILRELASRPADPTSVRERVRLLEHAGDELTHRLLNDLDSAALTAHERANLYRVANTLAAALDHMRTAAVLADIHTLTRLPPETRALIDTVVDCARLAATALTDIAEPRRFIASTGELDRLANRAPTLPAEPSDPAVNEVHDQLSETVRALCAVGRSATVVAADARAGERTESP
ncbi:DUF47 domain-containing protein [Nocardia takedensis]|uniref:DUF47 domain-containing protein n=1 Tax=Nocardia takedensis TaxID=259390 RepID=UPI000301E4E3|nr:DUF47 family protein [Nocardia takedensis]